MSGSVGGRGGRPKGALPGLPDAKKWDYVGAQGPGVEADAEGSAPLTDPLILIEKHVEPTMSYKSSYIGATTKEL